MRLMHLGGAGGTGGTSRGTATSGGRGGGSGGGGRIVVYNLTDNTSTETLPTNGATWTAASGLTGGQGASGIVQQANL